jgi:phosphate starvation-inducible PhoH-like protein
MKEKVDPYLRPLYDALHDMMPAEQVPRRIAAGDDRDRAARLHARPHAGDAFVILDEAQNTTPEQMKMFLTRMGEGTRMVVTGDPTQVDLPALVACPAALPPG